MLHILLHFLAPAVVALAFFRSRAGQATLVMIGTMVVDLDHLLATPIYDPERCSIGFHPLHTSVPIAMYVTLFVLTIVLGKWLDRAGYGSVTWWVRLAALGLLIHMGLDWVDCVS